MVQQQQQPQFVTPHNKILKRIEPDQSQRKPNTDILYINQIPNLIIAKEKIFLELKGKKCLTVDELKIRTLYKYGPQIRKLVSLAL